MNDNLKQRRYYLRALDRTPMLRDAASAGQTGTEDALTHANRMVLAPVLHGYILWLLKSALRDGVRRLYFLARDGYLPCRVAQDICEALELPIECRYFYCSRASLRIPMYHRDVEEALDHICRGGMEVTPGRILLRAGLDEEEARSLYPGLCLPYGWSETIPYAQLQTVREALRKNEAFIGAMCRNSAQAFPALETYFRQEGILDEGCFALVDSGWTGTMQRSIRLICEACGGKASLRGYYFGIYHLPPDCDPSSYSSFFFGPGWGLWNKARFNNNLFEVVFSAPHGTALGYRLENGTAYPVLGKPREQISSYILGLEEQLRTYTRALLGSLTAGTLRELSCDALRRTAAELLARFTCAPTRQEAESFGSLPFSDDLQDAGVRELAEKLSQHELRQNHVLPRILVMLGLRRGAPRQSAWFEGSAVRQGKQVLWHRGSFFMYKLLLYLRRR